jgi:hypothetical protein
MTTETMVGRDQAAGTVGAVTDDQLIAMQVDRAGGVGLQLTGEGGLLQQLTKRVLESALEGEIADHVRLRQKRIRPVHELAAFSAASSVRRTCATAPGRWTNVGAHSPGGVDIVAALSDWVASRCRAGATTARTGCVPTGDSTAATIASEMAQGPPAHSHAVR